jgi:hypothetical protein
LFLVYAIEWFDPFGGIGPGKLCLVQRVDSSGFNRLSDTTVGDLFDCLWSVIMYFKCVEMINGSSVNPTG